MAKITLDAETFKVLASDTRLSILKALDERPKTVSELGRQLELNKATVHEHLQQLLNGELIKKNDSEGRKWVYYTLSWKGRSLLHPENTTVLVLLGLAVAGSGAAAIQLGNWLRWWGQGAVMDVLEGGTESDESQETGLADDQRSDPESAPADADDASGQDTAQALAAPDEDNTTAEADTGSGPWWDFLQDGDFWIFGILLLMATALFVSAALVKARAGAGRP